MIAVLAAAFAVLLGVAGAAKIASPRAAAAMLTRAAPSLLRTRLSVDAAVRVGGVAELVVAVAVLAVGGRVAAALLAATYLVFVAVSLAVVRRAAGASCGCFGSVDSPVGAAHLVVTGAGVACALLAVARPAGPLAGLAGAAPAVLVTGLAQAALLAALAYLTITALPALNSARRRVEESA